jgi:hypothetical protein
VCIFRGTADSSATSAEGAAAAGGRRRSSPTGERCLRCSGLCNLPLKNTRATATNPIPRRMQTIHAGKKELKMSQDGTIWLIYFRY